MLTPSAVQNAKPKAKPYKLADERGMYLLVAPSGGKLWRFKYRRPDTKRENLLSLGAFPDVSLKRAREKRDEARRLLADGIDPGDKRKAEAQAGAETFEAVAREWFAKRAPTWSESYSSKIIEALERDAFPWIGRKPIAKLNAPDVLSMLRRIEGRTLDTAHRVRGYCGQVFRYAVASGRAQGDVTRDLRGALTPWKPGHFASITEPAKVGELLRAVEGFTGTFSVHCALKLAPMLFVRPGELRSAQWSEFTLDGEHPQWNIPAERMKMSAAHIVPLSTQAQAILRELRPLTGGGIAGKPDAPRYLFPGGRTRMRPMSNGAVNAALRRLGYDKDAMTGHGFRAMARTILDEVLGFRVDYIEHQLAHAVKDPNGRAYNRTAHLAERRKMMQAWADYLDSLRTGAKVIPLKRKESGASR